MPMTFENEDLEPHAKCVGFRSRNIEVESIDDYRAALADYMQPIDPVEAQEIRSGLPWNKWDDSSIGEVISRSPDDAFKIPLIVSRVFGKRRSDS